MSLNIDEFSSILEKKISDFKSSAELQEVGEVISVGDGIAKIYGLDQCSNW
jgi:F-type H+-transporting ATPase subunit alpha